jgi:ubiquinone biosynthesis protein
VRISLRPRHLTRYAEIARLFLKHGLSDVVKTSGLDEALDPATSPEPPATGADELAADLERLGPTFVKLGQLLSTRPDLLPAPYLDALARLQDRVEPFPFAEVEEIVSSELGVRLSRAFADFDPRPVAAASLGQVHRAALRDGRPVAVKVQRPDVRERIADDLEVLADIAEFLDGHTTLGERYPFAKMLEEFRASLVRELDYGQESRHLTILGRNLAAFESIVVPQPVEDYTTSRVLTMEYVSGTKITALSPVVRLELDGEELAEQLFRAYLQQILVDGFFHADPHPGNVVLTENGRIGLLDLGMVGWTSGRTQDHLLQLLLALAEGRSDEVSAVALKLGQATERLDEPEFTRRVAGLVARHGDARLEEIQLGRIVFEMVRTSAECGIRLPHDLTLLGKTLLNLDEVARTLAPDFRPNASIRRNAGRILQRRLLKSVSPGNVFSSLLEMKELFERLPGRLNRILDRIAANELEVKVDAIDEATLTAGFQKVANRITLGLLLAALIVGASLLMQVPTSFQLLGYPGLAIVLFLLAAAGGIALALAILLGDR